MRGARHIHAPYQSIHTWKDFFIHIATIVIGLLKPSDSNRLWSISIIDIKW